MSEIKQGLAGLTEDQRRLVEDNMGLVAVHLRRHVRDLQSPSRDREWEDLFQEGCLGLIQAATRHRPESGIPFAAFAFPRIHNAVSRALQTKFATIYVPPKRSQPREDCQGAHERGRTTHAPKVCSLTDELIGRLSAGCRATTGEPIGETVGQRLRAKYERAVGLACAALSSKASTRGDRDALIRILREERFLVPDEESRRALRQIARDTNSSYARVAQCDKRLGDAIRDTLEVDPEFHELRKCVRTNTLGSNLPIDQQVETRLLDASTEEFVRRFRSGSTAKRASVLHRILETSNDDLEVVVRSRFRRLPSGLREQLLDDAREPTGCDARQQGIDPRQPNDEEKPSRHDPSGGARAALRLATMRERVRQERV